MQCVELHKFCYCKPVVLRKITSKCKAIWYAQLYSVYSVYTLNQGTRRFHLKCVQCEHIEPKSKEVSFNMKGIFSCVRYYRKEIFAKGRGPVGLLILKEKY